MWVYLGLEASLVMPILGRNQPVQNHEQINELSMPGMRVLNQSA